jgi:predicted HTH transcriptional regulator
MIDLNELNKYREGNRLEVKKAEKGLPNSLWSTYSAFANKTSEISEVVSLSEGRVRYYLQKLVQDGMVVADGETHNRIYRLKA